jgi:hypothetical protein
MSQTVQGAVYRVGDLACHLWLQLYVVHPASAKMEDLQRLRAAVGQLREASTNGGLKSWQYHDACRMEALLSAATEGLGQETLLFLKSKSTGSNTYWQSISFLKTAVVELKQLRIRPSDIR